MEQVGIDLKSDEGMARFLSLVDGADVLIESFRPGVVDRLGIAYDALKGRNPRLVYCSTSGYGQTGPRAQWAGHDLNYLGAGGFLDCTGRRAGGQPPIPGATVADSAGGGMQAVIAILAAVVRRASTGEGAYLDVSAADGVLALMALAVDEYLAVGVEPGPGHGMLTGRYACYDVYGCADGKWLTVAAIEPRFWANLCKAVGLEQWIEHQTDDDLQGEIRGELAAVFRTKERDQWVAELGPADTCVAAVLSVPEVVQDEQFVARDAFVDASDVEHGAFRQVGYVLAGSGQ
jgi:crotonobetainyl-CoA:carnitine CoA-transferase CaiB-like acyl-CoA transferase